MRPHFQDIRHLVFLFVLFLVAIACFFALRKALTPAGFGFYGHYRAGSLDDNRARPLKFAGQAECVLCHDTQDAVRQKGKHARIACEACHGPQAAHANMPAVHKPRISDVSTLCASCHEKSAAKPKWFKQVQRAEHAGDTACSDCHQPHSPAM